MGLAVAIAGASGYVGGELLRLLHQHPDLTVIAATAHAHTGEKIGSVHPHLTSWGAATFVETSPKTLAEAELIFFALPHGSSGAITAELPTHVKIVDLGADHRLTDEDAWNQYYGGPYSGAWTYGLPELPGQRMLIRQSSRVAASGCYATATILALAPLIAAGVVDTDDIVVVAASGTSGAGRAAKINLLGSEVMGDLSAYKMGAHQHVPEIKQATGAKTVSFTPILAPLPRGIISTVTARPLQKITLAAVRDIMVEAYASESFIRVLDEPMRPRTAATYGSNSCHLHLAIDRDSGRVIVASVLDNLGKGAAGNMIQCANVMMGFPETQGLSMDGVAP